VPTNPTQEISSRFPGEILGKFQIFVGILLSMNVHLGEDYFVVWTVNLN